MEVFEKIVILDFGSQYTQLIARRVREVEVFSEVRPCHSEPIDLQGVKGIILSGGPSSVTDSDAPKFNSAWLELGLPVLGVCYGMQLMAHLAGGRLGRGAAREYGRARLSVLDTTDLFAGFSANEKLNIWMSHGDHVDALPAGYKVLASSEGLEIAAFANTERRHYALQFHPEVVHSERGAEILSNFVFKICSCSRSWQFEDFIEYSSREIKNQLGEGQAICGISGGVDSTVAACMVGRAVGKKLHCIFVDNGLLRDGEAEKVMNVLGPKGLDLNVHLVDASALFLKELAGVTDPEQKRKIIGRVFIEVFDIEANKIENATHLVQGTLYPDVIESVSVRGPSVTIKSHHNVGGLPEKMKLKLIEPLKELFKDEVRKLGTQLGLPAEVIQRQPFPGPGLAVRILGEITDDRLNILRQADKIFLEEIRKAGWYNKLWQSFAVLLPIQSVGVMGDCRTYEMTIALRAVHSEDGMTADWSYLPEDLLRTASNRIINEVKGVNRVVLDISSKPPATIEWE